MNERTLNVASLAHSQLRKAARSKKPAWDQNLNPALKTAAWQSNLEALLKILISALKLTEASFDTMFVVYGYQF